MRHSSLLSVVSGPSGVGKTVVIKALLERFPTLQTGVTYTTRPPRRGKKEDKIMRYVSIPMFQRMARAGEFLEWARVHDRYYGTPREDTLRRLRRGPVILNIDVQGALQVQKSIPTAILLFLRPASLAELRRRILRRGDMDPRELSVRLANARREIDIGKRRYDHVVVNAEGKIHATVEAVARIIANA